MRVILTSTTSRSCQRLPPPPVTGQAKGRLAAFQEDLQRPESPWRVRRDYASDLIEIPDGLDASRVIRMRLSAYMYVRKKAPQVRKTRWMIDTSGDVFAPVGGSEDAVSVGAILTDAKDGDLIDVTDAEVLFTARFRQEA